MTSPEEFNCLFCKESFDNKDDLQIHFRKHGDPKFNQGMKGKAQSETAGSGDKNDDGEMVGCDVCEELFPTISKAITHKHKMHPDHDAKYFCPWCGKLFTMKHLYNKHIQTSHSEKDYPAEGGFHCDYCDVDFFIPSAMVYHNKFFHRQDTELAAIGHSKKLKIFNQEPLQIFYCPFCGEEYCNKVNLHKHMGDDHIDENQAPEDVLRCPLCEAVFYHLDAYELHLTFHSSEDQYTEENLLIKDITEFSLETVPPMMEKVENESQDETADYMGGIEELLLQGMNDSNDNDTNDGSGPRKKKKHKKHKKSKKTITLDEFLNMHSDVLGEGMDVQGIVEVPTQVVTKQLRRQQVPRAKPRPKALPSPELEKLQRAGIVIKKKPLTTQRVKIQNKNVVCNTAKVGCKIRPAEQTKSETNTNPATKTSSNAILTKLLNQSNSQIKIVKKSAGGKEEGTAKEEPQASQDKITNNQNGEELIKNDTNADISNEDIKKNDNENENCTSQYTSHKIDNQSEGNDDINEPEKDDEENSEKTNNLVRPDKEFVNSTTNEKSQTPQGSNAINTLRNLGHHITIKSLSSPKVQNEHKPSPEKECDHDEHKDQSDTGKSLEEENTSKQNPTENANKNPLNVIKHLSHLTVKSANQQKVTTSPNVSKKDFVEKTDNIEHKDQSNAENSSKTPLKHLTHLKNANERKIMVPANALKRDFVQKTDVNEYMDESDAESTHEEDNISKGNLTENQNKTPINALKHLSHLTVKSANQRNITVSPTVSKNDLVQKTVTNNINSQKDDIEDDFSGLDDETGLQEEHSLSTTDVKNLQNACTKMDALKNLSKHITIKSLPQSPNSLLKDKALEECEVHSDFDEDFDPADPHSNNTIFEHKQSTPLNKQAVTKTVSNLKIPRTNLSPNHSPKMQIKQLKSETQCQNNEVAVYNAKVPPTNILKQLPNTITAKPLNTSTKKITQQTVTVQSSSQSLNSQKGKMMQSSFKKMEMKLEEEEIFNVDDSDDEDTDAQNIIQQNNKAQPIVPNKAGFKNIEDKSMNVLKNLGSQITIKPKSQNKPLIDDKFSDPEDMLDEQHANDSDNEYNEIGPPKSLQNHIDMVLQNKLKSLNSVKMKSNNSSPKTATNSVYTSPKVNSNLQEHYDSDEDNTLGKVKITELPDDYNSDEDIPLQKLKDNVSGQVVSNLDKIESDHEPLTDEFDDFEAQIKPTTLKKPLPNVNNVSKTPALLNNLKHLTVKSLKDKQDDEFPKEDSNDILLKKNNQLAIRQAKQAPLDDNIETNKPVKQQIRRAMNHNASTSNQVNTVNKEVTVQTFQTKTVIEEVTTTVTKTIRTVNQTTNEVQNMSQKTTPVRPQKIIGYRPTQVKNFQGMAVRHAAPNVGLRPRVPGIQPTRPSVSGTVRPANQLVPVRPGLNVARLSRPRMPTQKKGPVPSTSSHASVMGKPLRISPNAIMPASKRPAEETSGPFSCFKKPKESLTASLAEFTGGEDSSVQYSSSQMNRTNFTSMTRSVKGNSVVTSTQMKSEVSASSEQLSRLNSMSGLKVVKTSQTKQASKVEERSEGNPATQNTLSAIEKLQRQGLLVKKPRVEEPEDSDHSNPEPDEDFYDDT